MLKPDTLSGDTVEVIKNGSVQYIAKLRWSSDSDAKSGACSSLGDSLHNLRERLGKLGKKVQQGIAEIDEYLREHPEDVS